MKPERVHGHIMAKEDDGTLKVRVRQPGHLLDGKKLHVREVRGNVALGKGDDVSFLVPDRATAEDPPYAVDVVLVRAGEAGQGLSELVGTDSLLGIAGLMMRDGTVYYDRWYAASRQELQQSLTDAGGEERVLFYVRVTADEVGLADGPGDEPEAGFRALAAMLQLDSVRHAFNVVIQRVAEAVLKTAEQRVPAKPVVLAIDDRPEEIQALFTRTEALGCAFDGCVHVFKDVGTAFAEAVDLCPDITLVGHGLSAQPVTGSDIVRSLREAGNFGGILAGNSSGGEEVWERDGIRLPFYVNRDPNLLALLLGLFNQGRKSR